MWNCNFSAPFSFGIVGILVNLMMIVTIIYIIVLTVRTFLTKDKANMDVTDSLQIIKRKFASGEISEEEFQRMKDILTG